MNNNNINQQEENGQWIIVGKPKHKKIKKQQKIESKVKNGKIVWQAGKPLYHAQNQMADLQEFTNSNSFKTNKQILQDIISERYKKKSNFSIHIECLGLGNFIKHTKPRYQYYFLLQLLIPVCQFLTQTQLTINCYDPIFTQECLSKIKQIGTCLADNIPKQGQNRLIILYMPHCQRFLYERYCNIYNTNSVMVIGNSLKQYQNRCILVSEQTPKCFVSRQINQKKLVDYKQSLNDTFCYYI